MTALRPLQYSTVCLFLLVTNGTFVKSGCLAAGRAERSEPDWRVGSDFNRQLRSAVSVHWSAKPLAEAISELGRARRVATFVDRRVDPELPVTVDAVDERLSKLLADIAGAHHLDVTYIGSVIYLGPRSSSGALAANLIRTKQSAASIPKRRRARVQARRPVAWPRLSTPKALLERTAKQLNVEIRGIELVPYDVWPSKDLPPLDFCERLSLLLVGFDLSFQLNRQGSAVTLIPLRRDLRLTNDYQTASDVITIAQRIRRALPHSTVTQLGSNRIRFTGSGADHRFVDALVRTESFRSQIDPNPEKRYSLNVENKPVEAVLETLARRESLVLEIRLRPETESRLHQLISLTVEQAALSDVLDAVARRAELALRLDEDRLVVEDRGSELELELEDR